MNQLHRLDAIYQKIEHKERINSAEALLLWEKASWLRLGELAHARRSEEIGSDWASYTLFRIVNYTNICNVDCAFCSFARKSDEKRAYALSLDQVLEQTAEAKKAGADQIFLQGGVNPDLKLEYYINLLEGIKREFGFHIRGFSPVELRDMAKMAGLPLTELVALLKKAGLDSVPGAGAEILADRVRDILSPKKCSAQEWSEILAECHRQGLSGSANIVIGSVETNAEIIEHLDVVRRLQDQTGGFNSFIPWTFQPQTKDFSIRKVPHHEYLKLLALCRIYFDNIPNIEVSVMVLGTEIGKLAIQMGANDISSPVLEENVLRSYGVANEAGSRKLIQEAGLTPKRRDFNYSQFI